LPGAIGRALRAAGAPLLLIVDDAMSTTHPAQALTDGFSGQLLGPAQPGYEEARRVFNAMIDRRPALIARCATSADVTAAVHAAGEHGLAVAVRSGGHSFSGLSTRGGPGRRTGGARQ
jgi:FAD/FMN-containing dehydrogenase